MSVLRVVVAIVCLVLSFAWPAHAGPSPAAPPPIPEVLAPWIDWVAPAGFHCAMGGDSKAVCAWPGRLELEVDDKGGTFRLEARLDEGESLALPGSDDAWPLDVRVDDTPGVVLAGPRLSVGRGAHVVTGRFAWSTMPASLRVPNEIGLLRSLRVKGALVASPNRDQDGVSLVSAGEEPTPKSEAAPAEADKADLRVVRLLTTGRPVRLDTWIVLKISGKPRELLLGPVLPEGFTAIAVGGKSPAHLEADGRLRVRVSAGEDTLVVGAVAASIPTTIKRPAITGTWTTGDEVWAMFDGDPFQMTSIEGPPRLPKSALFAAPLRREIEEGNCFAMKDGAELRVVGRPRMNAAGADKLRLRRTFHIAGDGSGMSVADLITGSFAEPTRLEFLPPLSNGEAAVGSQRQVLGTVEGRPSGFEVPAAEQYVYANAWFPRVPWDFPADAFGRSYLGREVTFEVQPGWLPLHVSGTGNGLLDEIALGDLVLVALVIGAFFAVYGWRHALLAGVTLLLGMVYPKMPAAPFFLSMAVVGWIASRVPEKRVPVALFAHRALVVIAALALLGTTRTSLLLAFEPESVSFEQAVEEAPTAQDVSKSGGTGTKHKGAEGMMGDPSKNLVPIADDAPSAGKKSDAEKKEPTEFELRARSFDPNSLPQFGPGVPGRSWLSFTTQLPDGQTSIRAIWMPPLATALLMLLRVGLSIALVIALFRFRPKGAAAAPSSSTTAVAMLAAIVAFSPAAHAQVPSAASLDVLAKRLAIVPECRPSCAQIARLSLEARKKSLVLRMEVHAGEAVALPLPTGFPIADVLVDRRPAAIAGADTGLLARVEPGVHEVTVSGTLGEEDVSLGFGTLAPHRVQSLLDGWTLEGVRADGSAEAVLQLKSTSPGTAAAAPKATEPAKSTLPVMFVVRRQLDFDIEWKVRTTVTRLPSLSWNDPDSKLGELSLATVAVSLLPGETFVPDASTTQLEVRDGKVTVPLDPKKGPVAWTSTLAFGPELKLVAPAARDQFEEWLFTSSSRWRVTPTGVRPLPNTAPPTYAPWPGESLTLTLLRPTGLPGDTARLDSTELTSTDHGTRLSLTARVARISALGWSIDLPDGYELEPESVSPNWVQKGRTLEIKDNYASLKLRRPRRALDAILALAPAVKTSAKGVSASTMVQTSGWVVWASSPRSTFGGRLTGNLLGLSLAIVFAFLARLLGQDARRTALAALAGLMITTDRSLAALSGLVVFLLLVEARRRWVVEHQPTAPPKKPADVRKRATLAQGLLAVFGLVVVLAFVGLSITQALYGDPNARLGTLAWFLDRHDGTLPSATVVVLPTFVYRVVMIGWLAAWAWLLRTLLPWTWAALSIGAAAAAPPAPKPPEAA